MITLEKANLSDCEQIWHMQKTAFRDLLVKYRDTDTNPGAEPLDHIRRRMELENSYYYWIVLENQQRVGVIRVVETNSGTCRVSPMFLLPSFQGKGYAQEAIRRAEETYPHAHVWELDTIKQEQALCYLYEKMGYCRTGREEEIKPGMTIVYYRKSMKRTADHGR